VAVEEGIMMVVKCSMNIDDTEFFEISAVTVAPTGV
jgi:hypothetical protein